MMRRWVFSVPARVHPCLCGFSSETYAQMKRHRRKCLPWQHRADPRGLTITRRKTSRFENTRARALLPCPACGGAPQEHTDDCPHSLGAVNRREALVKNGIDPAVFAAFLVELAKRYPSGRVQ